jgi:creatinine amidohydrolase
MAHTGRAWVLTEATLAQLRELKPNVAVQPWGATEGHNYHLPHGTDCVEVTAIAEGGIEQANAQGARCVLLPTIPYGNDNLQLDEQIATITMRTATQYAVMRDVAYSLVRQGIDRLVILNGHGGNEFTAMIRDIMIEYPIFIVRINSYGLESSSYSVIENKGGDHANEWETSAMLYLRPGWVTMETAADGAVTPSKLPKLTGSPAVWYPRHWAVLSKSSGVGDPRKGTAEKGEYILKAHMAALAPILVELSAAKEGDFPYVTSASWPHRKTT